VLATKTEMGGVKHQPEPPSRISRRPKATPRLPGFVVPTHFRVRRDKVDITGTITLRHNSRLHHIGLGRRLISTRVPPADLARGGAGERSLQSSCLLAETARRPIRQCPREESNLRSRFRKLMRNWTLGRDQS
jgi:hypothetical protein